MRDPWRADLQYSQEQGTPEGQHGDSDGRFGEDLHVHRPFFVPLDVTRDGLAAARARLRALMLASSASSSASLSTLASTRPLTSSSTEPWQKRSRMGRTSRAHTR